MKQWLNWAYVVRGAGLATMGLGALWHSGELVLGGLAVIGAPTVFSPDKGRDR